MAICAAQTRHGPCTNPATVQFGKSAPYGALYYHTCVHHAALVPKGWKRQTCGLGLFPSHDANRCGPGCEKRPLEA